MTQTDTTEHTAETQTETQTAERVNKYVLFLSYFSQAKFNDDGEISLRGVYYTII
jgi:hypothetical protein